MPGRRLLFGALCVALTACGSDEPPEPGRSLGSGDPECGAEGFPCTWNEVPPRVVERTDALGEIAGLYGVAGASLEDVAAFLRERRGVAFAEVIGTGVRFRLEGGRPAWVYPEDELAHHRRPAPGGVTSTRPTAISRTVTSTRHATTTPPSAPGRRALFDLLAPAPALAAADPGDGEHGVAAEEPGDGKKALILSPFEWEFPGTGPDLARRARVIRDYREEHGGQVTYHGDLDPFDDNPAEPGEILVDGTPLLSGPVEFDDFLQWNEYNLVVLASHGTEHRCGARAPVGGERIRDEDVDSGESGGMCPLIWAGRAKQESYGDHIGVEVITFVQNIYEPHPGLTGPEAAACAGRLEAREQARREGQAVSSEELATPGGKPCRVEKGQREKRLVALWTPFFKEHYPRGLENVIVFLGACRSGINDVLLEHLAPDGNRHVAVFGFDDTVDGGDAFAVGEKLLELMGEGGFHTKETLEELKRMDRTRHLVGRALAPGDEQLPARPAEIVDASAGPTHGRDVVLLVDPDTGEELREGQSILVRGVPKDGEDDILEIYADVIGVAESDPRDQIRLHVSVVGETNPEDSYRPETPVGPGRYRWSDGVALGRDHREGEIVDLEVRADLPGGGLSRWFYRRIHLGGCYWELDIEGTPRAGHYSGSSALFIPQGEELAIMLTGTDPYIMINIGVKGEVHPTSERRFSMGGIFSPAARSRGWVDPPDDGLVTIAFQAEPLMSHLVYTTGDGTPIYGGAGGERQVIGHYPPFSDLFLQGDPATGVRGRMTGTMAVSPDLQSPPTEQARVELRFRAESMMEPGGTMPRMQVCQ